MAIGRRPKRHNPKAERLTFRAELEQCPRCGEPLSSEGCSAHSAKTVQTLDGEFYVVAYSRRCRNPECANCGQHVHAAGHLKISLPYSTYGLDVVALTGIRRERRHEQFSEIQALLNERGVAINEQSVGRLYRLFLALMEGTWPQRRERLAKAVEQYGGLILLADALQPDGEGPHLYALWEVLSGTPISGLLIDQADTPHLTAWLTECRALIGDLTVLATLSDSEKALVAALTTVWPEAAHQLCQLHFMKRLSEPVHTDDSTLQQSLKDDLSPLPAVPDLEPEEAAARIESLVTEPDRPLSAVPEPAAREAAVRIESLVTEPDRPLSAVPEPAAREAAARIESLVTEPDRPLSAVPEPAAREAAARIEPSATEPDRPLSAVPEPAAQEAAWIESPVTQNSAPGKKGAWTPSPR